MSGPKMKGLKLQRRGTDDIFSSGRIAKLLGVSPRTINMYCMNGHLKHYRIDTQCNGEGDRRVTRTDLLNFLREKGIPIPMEIMPRIVVSFGFDKPLSDKITNFDCPLEFGAFIRCNAIHTVISSSESLGRRMAVKACDVTLAHNSWCNCILLFDSSIADESDKEIKHKILYKPIDMNELVMSLEFGEAGIDK